MSTGLWQEEKDGRNLIRSDSPAPPYENTEPPEPDYRLNSVNAHFLVDRAYLFVFNWSRVQGVHHFHLGPRCLEPHVPTHAQGRATGFDDQQPNKRHPRSPGGAGQAHSHHGLG